MNLCSSYSHLLSTHICAVPNRRGRAECRAHLLFSPSRRPPCIAAVCWFLIWVCVFRPDDACQKRFSWFSDWIQKVQQFVNLVDLVKSFHPSIYSQQSASIQPRTSLSKFGGDFMWFYSFLFNRLLTTKARALGKAYFSVSV